MNLRHGRKHSHRLRLCPTRLQPRYDNYWDEASWQMAYNAASSYRYNEELNPAVREKIAYQYEARGIEILNEGLQIMPDNAKLWARLGEIYHQRVINPAKAGDCYLQAYKFSNVPYFMRVAGYQYALTKDPVLWQKAYDLLRTAYDRRQRPPSLITELKSLEERLNIPMMRRIPDAAPVIPRPTQQQGVLKNQ